MKPKPALKSITIVSALIGLLTLIKDRLGWDISESEIEQYAEYAIEFASFAVVMWGRLRATKTVTLTGASQAGLILLPMLFLVGCATGTNLTPGVLATTNLGHPAVRMDSDSIASTGLDTPTVIWSDAEQHTKASPFAETAMTIALPNGMALHLTSPKDGDVESVSVTFNPNGELASVEISGVHYSASDVLIARGQELIPLVDYAIALSADERDRFLAAVGMVNTALEAAIKAALP